MTERLSPDQQSTSRELRLQTILKLGFCGRCGGSGSRCEDALFLLVDCRCCSGTGSHAEAAVPDALVDECYRGLHGADESQIPNTP